jgi:hypothetical protein
LNQTNPSQLLEVKDGNLLLSNSGTADQLQFQGTGAGVTTFQAGAQGATNINYTLPTTAPTVNGQALTSTTAGVMSWATSGTVTSVGLALPASVFNVSGSPVTTSGTLTGSFTTQTANTVFAGPASGAAATPTFRALVPADLPSLNTLAWLITGNTGTTAYNGTTGNFLGTTDAQPLVIATTNTSSSQPIEFYTNNTEQMRLTSAGKLGIGNNAPNTSLDVSKDFATREYNYSTSMPASSNDMNFDGSGNQTALVRVATAAAGFTLTGLAGGQNGKLLTLYNASGQQMSIANQSASSIAANRFITGTGATLIVPSGGSVNLGYSPTDSRWFVNSINDVSLLTGNYVNYNTASVQNAAVITSPNYLFNTAYAASATANNALGAVITSASGTSAATNATGLTVTATANGAGTSTGLNVTAGGGTTNYAALFNGGNVGIGQSAPSQLLEVKSGNLLLSNAGTADQLQFQGTGAGITSIQAGAQGATNLTYTLPTSAPSASSILYSAGGTSSALSWTNTGTAGQVLTISGGVPSWQNSAASSGGWLTGGNSGLVDNTSNLLGTLDNISVRFIAGATGTPNTRMLLDYQRGDLLLGSNSGTSSFSSSGGGRFAMGNALSTTTLNSIPTSSSRTFNIIDSFATLRLWRYNTLTSTNDPTLEFVGGVNTNQGNAANTWWDMYTTGTPYTTNTGTHSSGEHLAIRRRTGSVDSELVSVFANGNVGIGEDGSNTGGVANAGSRLTVSNNDAVTSSVTNILALQHNSTGTPAANFGTGLVFRGKDSTTKNQDMASINAIWGAANHTTHTSSLTFSVDSLGTTTSPTERMRLDGTYGYLGVNATNPGVRVDINGGYATRSRNVTIANGTNNDVPVGDCAYLRLIGPTTAFTITGLAAGVDGQRLRVIDVTGYDMTIANGSTLSAYGNRIETDVGSDIIVKGTAPVLDMTYDSTLHEWMLGTLNANQIIGGVGSILFAYKTANETRTNTAVLANDADLVFTVAANQTWEVAGALDITEVTGNNNNGGFEEAFTIPAGSNMRVFYQSMTDKNGNGPQGSYILNTSGVGSPNGVTMVAGQHTLELIQGIVIVGSVGGNIQFKWAQNAANADGTILNQYSYFRLTRIK